MNEWSFFEHVPEEIKKLTRGFYINSEVCYVITTDRRVLVFLPSNEQVWPHAVINGFEDLLLVDMDPRFSDSGIALRSNGTAVIFSYFAPKRRPLAIRANGLVAVASNAYNRLVVNGKGNVTVFSNILADGDIDEKNKITLDRKQVRSIACSSDWSLVMNQENHVTRWYKSAIGSQLLDVRVSDKFKSWATSGKDDVLLLSESDAVFGFANDEAGTIWQLLLPEPIDHVFATGAGLYAAYGKESKSYYIWGEFKSYEADKVEKMKKNLFDEKNHSTQFVDYVKTQSKTVSEVVIKYALRQDTPHVMWISQNDQIQEEDGDAAQKPKVKAEQNKKVIAVKSKATKKIKLEEENHGDQKQEQEEMSHGNVLVLF